jgi:hypothetical protein
MQFILQAMTFGFGVSTQMPLNKNLSMRDYAQVTFGA